MDWTRDRFVIGPVLLACATALALQHGTDAVRIGGLAGMLCLVLATLRHPVVAVVALLPLLYAIPPAPREIGVGEVGIAGLAIALLLGTILRHRSAVTALLADRYRWVVVAVAVFVLVNAVIAFQGGVRPVEWLRGVIPFGFLVLLVPTLVLVDKTRLSVTDLMFSACAASMLFGAAVLGTFYAERLWEDTWWVYDPAAAEWFRIAASQAPEFGNRASRWGPIRVTQVLPRATDPLVGVGFVVGTLLFTLPAGRLYRAVGLVAATVAALAVCATVTRSYIGALGLAWLTITAILLWTARRSGDWTVFRRYLLATAGISVVVAAFLVVTGLDAQISGRIRQTTMAVEGMRPSPGGAMGGPGADGGRSAAGQSGDENLHARIVEYKVAWGKFLDAPLLGNGFGTSHVIHYPLGGGKFRAERVGYVHNWVLYFLMTGGVVGLLGYACVLGGAAVALAISRAGTAALAFTVGTMVLLSVYGLFFAVFRLISFNILVVMCWAVALTAGRVREGES